MDASSYPNERSSPPVGQALSELLHSLLVRAPAFAAYRHRLICDGNVVGGLILLRAPEGSALVGMTILSNSNLNQDKN
jgi:hypothetical protein